MVRPSTIGVGSKVSVRAVVRVTVTHIMVRGHTSVRPLTLMQWEVGGCHISPENTTKVYDSMLLALREGGSVSIFQN